jgi:hypothetical protein
MSDYLPVDEVACIMADASEVVLRPVLLLEHILENTENIDKVVGDEAMEIELYKHNVYSPNASNACSEISIANSNIHICDVAVGNSNVAVNSSDIDWGNPDYDNEYEEDDRCDDIPSEHKKKRSKKSTSTIGYTNQPVVSCIESYVGHFNSKNWLLAMGIGVTGVNVDTNTSPYAASKKKKTFVPTSKEMQGEVIRRAVSLGLPTPRPRGWNFRKCYDWLSNNKVTDEADILFLKKEIGEFTKLLEIDNNERCIEDEANKVSEAWFGPEPYLRLYHVMLDDNVREAFTKVHNVMSRSELDARNSSEKPKDFYELAADLYNDPDFNPVTSVYKDLHTDFSVSIELLYKNAPCPVTPSKIKEKLADVRAKLVILISNW